MSEAELACEHSWRFLRSESKWERRPILTSITKVCRDGKKRTYSNRVVYDSREVTYDTFFCEKCLEYRRKEVTSGG